MPDREKVVDFEKPPVMEVVFGAMFTPLRRLQSPHLGRLWERWSGEFPRCQDVPPLLPTVDEFDGKVQVAIMMSNLPDLPRVWLLSADDRTILQLQRDRLHVNRRRLSPMEPYEGFDVAMPRFDRIWNEFGALTKELCDETPSLVQLELTYVNVIPACEIFNRLGQVGRVFPAFVWPEKGGDYLQEPDSVEWTTSFRLPETLGRLHVTIRGRSPRGQAPVVFEMELTARGRPKSGSADDRAAWFMMARNAIDRGFIDFTHPKMHTDIWRRTR